MTDLTEAKMARLDDEGNGKNGRRILWVLLAFLGIVMTAGAIAGYLAEHQAQGGGPLDTKGGIALGVFIAIGGGLAYSIFRNGRTIKLTQEPLTRRERLNRNIMVGCGVLGGLIGIALAIGGIDQQGIDVFSTSFLSEKSISPALAILLVVGWAIVMPVVAWIWHTRAIDEQEASAYRDGGYYSAYIYLIGAPTWWILWRGGFAPEPNGVAIFLIFSSIWSAVWFWKKYR
jgi:hypothetical protein